MNGVSSIHALKDDIIPLAVQTQHSTTCKLHISNPDLTNRVLNPELRFLVT